MIDLEQRIKRLEMALEWALKTLAEKDKSFRQGAYNRAKEILDGKESGGD